jgi:hypothetical protein
MTFTDILTRFGLRKAVPKAYLEVEISKRNNGKPIYKIRRHRRYYAKMQQDELKLAIREAESVIRPNRMRLHAIYHEAVRDRHLRSQIRTHILKVIGSPFAVYKKGTDTIDEAMTKALQKQWFEEYRTHFHWTPWWGHTLVEFPEAEPVDDEGLQRGFKYVKLFPRDHVLPEKASITIYPYDDSNMVRFDEEPLNKWLIEIGKRDDIGLLSLAAEDVIWKKYSRSDWSRHSEKFGMPILLIKTASKKDSEIDELENMASNFGNNLWAIVDDQDEAEILEAQRTDAYEVYKQKALFCNEEMSKLAVGQTLTSGTDGKGSYALGEVHEDVLNEYVEAGMRSEMYHVNDVLFPFLIEHGYPLKGLEFRYLAFNKEDDNNDGNQPPNKKDDAPPNDGNANFTKPLPEATGRGVRLADRVDAFYAPEGCCGTAELSASIADLEKAAQRAAVRVWQRKLKAGKVDKQTFLQLVDGVWKSTYSGYQQKLKGISYGSTRHQMLLQLRHNAFVFSAFKNHHNINELVKALVDENGHIVLAPEPILVIPGIDHAGSFLELRESAHLTTFIYQRLYQFIHVVVIFESTEYKGVVPEL